MKRTSIKGQQLRTFLGGNSSGTTSVILEARRPPIPSAILRRLREPASLAASRKSMLAEQLSSGGLQQSMSEVGAALEALGLQSVARRLDLAGCFVVEVNRKQLAALAEVPAIQGIRPNVTRRRESTDELVAALSTSG